MDGNGKRSLAACCNEQSMIMIIQLQHAYRHGVFPGLKKIQGIGSKA
jgi:hypothetical protein